MNILASSYDIIVLTESWLIPEINDSEFIDQRYVVFRRDRDRIAAGRHDGGGVLIAVLRGLHPVELNLAKVKSNVAPPSCIEHIILEIPSRCSKEKHIISAAYIPPWATTDNYESHFDLLQDALINPSVDRVCILGDYNLPNVTWSIDGPNGSSGLTCNDSSSKGLPLINFMSILNSLQYNSIVNSVGNILDLCICNSPCTVHSQSNSLVNPDPYHPPFVVYLPFPLPVHSLAKTPMVKHNYRKADYIQINKAISDTNWIELLSHLSAEDAVDKFYNSINCIIKDHVPLSSLKASNFPIWFSHSTIKVFNKKQKAWVKWKKYNNNSDYLKFSDLRVSFKDMCKNCFKQYMQSVEDNISTNIKYFWSYIANRKSKSGIPSCMAYQNNQSTHPETICNMFSDFFKSVFEPSSPTLCQWRPSSNCSNSNIMLSNLIFDEDKVLRELRNLDPSKGPGPDGIPPSFLKNTASTIYVPLTILYNKCISHGTFPEIWKHAYITPVHKSGSKQDIEQYRPISILSTLSKLFERLVHNEIYPILHNILIQEQHGFVKRRSTNSNLIIFTTSLFESLDRRVQVDAVYTDFKKAFDKVDHEMLLNKISYNGIRGDLLRWFQSYITNRSQKVVINGYQSSSVLVTSGVPQGSILGPLLFVLFINDINHCFQNSKFLLYADDLKAYMPIKTIDDCTLFQQDLDRLSIYCKDNKLQLSLPKCNVITFTKNINKTTYAYSLCDTRLNRVTCLRDLGVQLDSQLCLNLHVENIVNKAFKMFGFIMRSSADFKRSSTYLYLYKTLVRPQLEFAVAIWNPFYKKYVSAIEKVQRRYLRTMNYRCFRNYISYSDLLNQYKLLSLESRRKYLEAVTLYNIVRNEFDCMDLVRKLCYVVPRTCVLRKARNRSLFALSACRTNSGLRSPVRRMVESYNKTFNEIDIFTCSLYTFKSQLVSLMSKEDSTLYTS